MGKKIFALIMMVVFSVLLLHTGAVLAQDGEVTTTSGEVEDVDSENNGLTVKYMIDDINIVYEELHFTNITKETRITKGDETVELDDLQVGDNVTVRYSGRNSAVPKLLTVVVEQ